MKILVTGSKGQLGAELLLHAPPTHQVFGYDLDMDVTDIKRVEEVFQSVKPDVAIHCAAYTNVDACEDASRQMAITVNALGSENMAIMAKKYGASLAYISTDYVFDGEKGSPYIEYDMPNPISYYGLSKYYGELAVKEILPDHFILRTTGIYSPHAKNFVETIISYAKNGSSLTVVDDQICTPTYSLDMAQCIYRVIESGFYGTYHTTNAGQCSWHEFASEIFRILHKDVHIDAIKTLESNRKAMRPKYSVLANYKLEKRGLMQMRPWQEALKDFLVTQYMSY
jgi:dTDP-4-dehydrorhamnose reductase